MMVDNYWAGIIRHLEAKVEELEEKIAILAKDQMPVEGQGCSMNGNLRESTYWPRHPGAAESSDDHPINS